MNFNTLFKYSADTGLLSWAISPAKNVKVGDTAGSITNRGYLTVSVAGGRFLAHRVVWEMHNGTIPNGLEVDHINHLRTDNRIENLRLVTRRDNLRNQSVYKNNTSGHTGVSFDKFSRKWRAHITVSGRTILLGRFSDLGAAVSARKYAETQYGFHANHGVR